MSQHTLTLIEASGIQDYVFGSNQLAQNIGASELVGQATEGWVKELVPNADSIVYAGGGNAMLIFDAHTEALGFTKQLTRRALERAPGLHLVVKHRTFDPGQDVLAEVHQQLRGELAQRKLDRLASVPLLGLGVTAACVYTGAPAVTVREDQLISAQVRAKLDAEEAGKQRLKDELKQVGQRGYEFVYNFDDFGTKGESSYLAVIHTDGNAMGDHIKKIGQDYPRPEDNDAYIAALKAFSASVRKAAEKALNATAELLLDSIVDTKDGKKVADVVPVPIRDEDNTPLLPFRPIVFGGDDVTFVCEGRLGLTVAAKYLSEFSQVELFKGKAAHARAGIAIVKSHYPFSRAYALAEDLCQSAKAYLRQASPSGELTALDWHFAVTGLVLPLAQVREREYQVPAGSLLMRPLRLKPETGDWRTWRTFTSILDEFERPEAQGGQWAGRRNKLIALRETLREGPAAVQHFLHLHEPQSLPDVPGRPEMQRQGWQGSECGYFDAVEAVDFYVPLEGGSAG